MTYGVVLVIAGPVLAGIFVVAADASPWVKVLVAAASIATFFIPWTVARVVAQLVLSVGLLLYFRVKPIR